MFCSLLCSCHFAFVDLDPPAPLHSMLRGGLAHASRLLPRATRRCDCPHHIRSLPACSHASTSSRLSHSSNTSSSSSSSRPHGHLPGHPNSPYLTNLADSFFDTVNVGGKAGLIPTFRMMDGTGNLLDGVQDIEVRMLIDRRERLGRGEARKAL